MLGIRLSEEAERRLARHAREVGRPKSMLARDWILDRLEREEVDAKICAAASLHAADQAGTGNAEAVAVLLRTLDAEDGGYDWGPDGPPAPL